MTRARTLHRSSHAKARRKTANRTILGVDKTALWLILPALVPVVTFSVFPLIRGIYLGFTDAQAGNIEGAEFTGFANYLALLSNDLFWDSFRVGLIWAFGVTILQFFSALGLALLLNQRMRFRGLVRTVAIIPWAMPHVVIALTWKLLYSPNAGFLNDTLNDMGILSSNVDWLGDPRYALPAVILVGVWAGLPQTAVILLAGLQNVPNELHEAAAMDGANTWTRFRVVTWPAIAPVAFAITSLDFIWNFNSFGFVYVLTQGGPGGSTRLPMLFAYEEAFNFGNYGYAAALGNAMVIIIAVPLIIYLRKQLKAAKS